MKFANLYQDPENESPAPYADCLVLDAGGMTLRAEGEELGHVSFEGVDPFEVAFHAIPDDWEPHAEFMDRPDGNIDLNPLTRAQIAENAVNLALILLGRERGWERI